MGTPKQQIQIQEVALEALKEAPYNPRKISKEALQGLEKSIQHFGLVQLIVWNRRTGHVVSGHQRLKILKKQGVAKTKVVVVDLPLEEEKALNLTSNNPAISGEFTTDLGDLLKELEQELPQLDLGDSLYQDLLLDDLTKEIPYTFRAGQGGETLEASRDRELYSELSAGAGYLAVSFSDIESAGWTRNGGMLSGRSPDTLVVFFSGGRDSTGALLWGIRQQQLGYCKTVQCLYVDTGVELPGTTQHVFSLLGRLGIPVEILTPRKNFLVHYLSRGEWPSLLWRDCIGDFIHQPLVDYVKAHYDPTSVIILTGSRNSQAVRGAKKLLVAKAFPGLEHYTVFSPCLYSTEEEITQSLADAKVPLWPGYALGFVRTACWCCPGQCAKQARALLNHYPGFVREIFRMETLLGPLRPTSSPVLDFGTVVLGGLKGEERKKVSEDLQRLKASVR